jgi:hypothetical protein
MVIFDSSAHIVVFTADGTNSVGGSAVMGVNSGGVDVAQLVSTSVGAVVDVSWGIMVAIAVSGAGVRSRDSLVEARGIGVVSLGGRLDDVFIRSSDLLMADNWGSVSAGVVNVMSWGSVSASVINVMSWGSSVSAGGVINVVARGVAGG